jgi:DNA-binding GntR family transcriptional regulator
MRKPRRGVFVTEMTENDVWEAYTLKAALYEMATELAMDSITNHQVRQLDAVVRKMEHCVAKKSVDLLRYQEYHQRFHDDILRISGNFRLRKISSSIHNQVCRFSYQSLQNRHHLYSSVRYHRKIIKAIQEKDKLKACKLMKEHVLKAIDAFHKVDALTDSGSKELPVQAVKSN